MQQILEECIPRHCEDTAIFVYFHEIPAPLVAFLVLQLMLCHKHPGFLWYSLLLLASMALFLPITLSQDPPSSLHDSPRRNLSLEDIQPCDQARCSYLVFVYTEVAGPEAEASIKSIAGEVFVELVQAETYSGTTGSS
jgi:hypothetical protein